jgi:uncharacterized protein
MSIFVGIVVGLIGGFFSGLFGIGGATVIIPLLVFFLGFTQHQAQGTALAALLPPVGILAVLRYYYSGNVIIDIALYTSLGFIVGGLIGSVVAQPIPSPILKKLFALYLIGIGIKMMF